MQCEYQQSSWSVRGPLNRPWKFDSRGLSLRPASENFDNNMSTLKQTIEEAERQAISSALAENDNNLNQAADYLGIPRKKFWEKMESCGFER